MRSNYSVSNKTNHLNTRTFKLGYTTLCRSLFTEDGGFTHLLR